VQEADVCKKLMCAGSSLPVKNAMTLKAGFPPPAPEPQ